MSSYVLSRNLTSNLISSGSEMSSETLIMFSLLTRKSWSCLQRIKNTCCHMLKLLPGPTQKNYEKNEKKGGSHWLIRHSTHKKVTSTSFSCCCCCWTMNKEIS